MTDDQPPPPPSRRDHETPAAGHHGPPPSPDHQLRDAWLAELWPTCPEVPREQREIDRYIAAEQARHRGPGAAA